MKSLSEAFLKAALPPSHYLTGKTADRRDQRRFTARPGPARRFDGPSGGTEEFLGRQAARPCSRRAQAKGTLADLIYVFGAAGRAVGSHNDRTSRCSQEGRPNSTRCNRHNRTTKSGTTQAAPLGDFGHIWVRPFGQGFFS